MYPRTRTRPTPTLGQTLRRAVITSVASVAAVAAGYGLTSAAVASGLLPTVGVLQTEVHLSAPDEKAGSTPEEKRNRAAHALFTEHDCWATGEGMPTDMRGKVPGHVIVTPAPTAETPRPWPRYSVDLVGPALEHLFGEDPSPGMTVHAFCR